MSVSVSAGSGGSRLFVAVWPPAEVCELIDRLPRPDESGVRWEPPGLAHVTLRFIGESEPDPIIAALRSVPLPSATAALGPSVSRLGRSVLCVPVAGLEALAAGVDEAVVRCGLPPRERTFAGHLTLARLRQRAACGLAGHRLRADFPVTEIAVVRSVLPSGVEPVRRYETLEMIPLRD